MSAVHWWVRGMGGEWLRGSGLVAYCAAGLLLLSSSSVWAQQALRKSLAGPLEVAERKIRIENEPYTFKAGDFRVLVSGSLGAEYNDNVARVENREEDDFLLRPLVNVNASYPVTSWNLLRLRLGIGYDYYFEHSELSSLRLESGSELSFDIFIKDFWINLHNRFEYLRNSGSESGVAGTARYGGLDNTAGITGVWDLNDVVLTLGYDHHNFLSSSDRFEYLDRATEILLARAGFRVHPRLITGLEASGAFTSYDERVLNDSSSYSVGAYADWRPGDYFQLVPRAGYTSSFFDQTSRFIEAVDEDTWYADVTLTHAVTEAVSYSIRGGHELRLGIDADTIEATYVRPSVTWRAMKNFSIRAGGSYENGSQGSRGAFGALREDFEWLVAGVVLTQQLAESLSVSLEYRHTLRSSDALNRDYSQNVVGLRLTYAMR